MSENNKSFAIRSICYGVYDTELNSYRYLFTSNSPKTAKRQFIGYCVGSNDLFSEPLELHSISSFGSKPGDIEIDFKVLCSYDDISKEVISHRERIKGNYDIHHQ